MQRRSCDQSSLVLLGWLSRPRIWQAIENLTGAGYESSRLQREHPTCTERKSLIEQCGWKGGDSDDSAGENLVQRKTKEPS